MTSAADRLGALEASAARLATLSRTGSISRSGRNGTRSPPRIGATEVVVADRALLDRLDALSDDERAGFKLALGPFELDLATAIGLRLNEHVLHTN